MPHSNQDPAAPGVHDGVAPALPNADYLVLYANDAERTLFASSRHPSRPSDVAALLASAPTHAIQGRDVAVAVAHARFANG